MSVATTTFTWQECQGIVKCVAEVQHANAMEIDIDWVCVYQRAKEMNLQVLDPRHCRRIWNAIAYGIDTIDESHSASIINDNKVSEVFPL